MKCTLRTAATSEVRHRKRHWWPTTLTIGGREPAVIEGAREGDDVNEYAHIPPPPPAPPVGWVPYQGVPGTGPVVPPRAPALAYATPSSDPRRARRRWAAMASVVALGASIFGVAAVARHDAAPARSPLAAAIEGTQAQKTARVDITVEAPGLASPFTTTAEVDLDAGVSHLTVDPAALAGLAEAPAELGSGPVEVISKGSVVYLKLNGLGELLGGSGKWLKIDATAFEGAVSGRSEGSFDTPDAAALLDLLQQHADSFTEVGHENVRGVDTTRSTAVIDLARLAQEHAAGLDDPSVTTGIEKLAGATATVDVWIDGDNFVRKLAVHGDSAQGAATVTVELYDFGKPVDASVPADADTIDVTALVGHR